MSSIHVLFFDLLDGVRYVRNPNLLQYPPLPLRLPPQFEVRINNGPHLPQAASGNEYDIAEVRISLRTLSSTSSSSHYSLESNSSPTWIWIWTPLPILRCHSFESLNESHYLFCTLIFSSEVPLRSLHSYSFDQRTQPHHPAQP